MKKYFFIASYIFLQLLCPHFLVSQTHTLEITQWPSSYETYFDSLETQDTTQLPKIIPQLLKKETLNYYPIEIKQKEKNPMMLIGENKTTKIIVSFSKFDTSLHKIGYDHNTIDGKGISGTDGISPGFFEQWNESPWKGFTYQYLSKIEISINGKTYTDTPTNRAFYLTCPSAETQVNVYEIPNKQLLIIYLSGGDGAGTYQSFLYFKDGKYLTNYEWVYGYGWYVNNFGKDYFGCKDKKGCIYDFKIDTN